MEVEKKVVELDLNDVLPNRFQPRIKFNEDSINELAESIKEHGVIQPIVVRAMGDKYEIIAGERRYKASLLAGKKSIPAIVTDLNDKDSAEVALIENVQRKDLTPIEEAISYKKILDMGYLTQEELAVKLGKTQSTVANKLRLLNLAEEVQEAVLEEKISERHARSLLRLQDQSKQVEMLNKIIENRLTVRKTDEEIQKMLKPVPIVIEAEDDGEVKNPFDEIRKNKKEEGMTNMDMNFDPFSQDAQTTAAPFDALAATNEPIAAQELIKPQAPVEPVVANVDPTSTVVPATNPGFMDVTNIENNAQDINVEKPAADMTSLLTPTVNPVEVPTPAPVQVEQEPVSMENGKFFSLPIEEEKEEANPFEKSQDTLPSDQKPLESSTDIFNFSFDDVPAPVAAPAAPAAPVAQPELAPAAPAVDVAMPTVEPVVHTPEVVIPAVEPVAVPTPVAEIPAEPATMPASNVAPVVTTPIADSNAEAPVFDFMQPNFDTTPTQSVEPQNSVDAVMPVVEPVAPQAEETPAPADMPAFVEPSIMPVNINQPVSSDDMPIPTLGGVQEPVKRNVTDAINAVRECAKKLEQAGFVVNTEEIDFESIYQVIFKIQK